MKIKQTVIVLALLIGLGGLMVSPIASAKIDPGDGTTTTPTPTDAPLPDTFDNGSGSSDCGGVKTSVLSCDGSKDSETVGGTGIWGLLLMGVNILTGLIGVAAVGGILYGSILYTTSRGKPEQSKKASTVLTNTMLGVLAYALMYSLLNFLIPGGMF